MKYEGSILDLPNDDIYLLLGAAILDGSYGAEPVTDDEKKSAGKRWAEDTLTKSKEKICKSKLIEAILYKQEADGAIALGLTMLVLVNVGVFSEEIDEYGEQCAALATLVLRKGIANFCDM